MANKKEENKMANDETLATQIKPDADVKKQPMKEVVAAKAKPTIADVVSKGDNPPRKLKEGETYLGGGTIKVES